MKPKERTRKLVQEKGSLNMTTKARRAGTVRGLVQEGPRIKGSN